MQFIVKEFEPLSKMARGERTLGQHIDRLFEVTGNAKEVKNLMKKVPMVEAKNRVLEKANSDTQKRMDNVEARMGNIEKMIKKMVDHNSNILKTVVDNFSRLLKKFEQDKGHDSPTLIKN